MFDLHVCIECSSSMFTLNIGIECLNRIMSVRPDSVINIFEYQDESFVKGREG